MRSVSTQVGVRSRATDDLAEVKQEGKGSAAQCQLPLLAVPLIDETLSCSVKQLWSIICKPDPAFQATIHRLSGNKDIQYGDWQQQGKTLTLLQTVPHSSEPTASACRH